MQCMKCGRETESGQVFCRDCLAEMEKYPVKPGTPVYIPNQAQPVRKPQRYVIPVDPEEQVRRLRRKVRWLGRCLFLSLLALAVCCVLILRLYRQEHRPPTGQDYNVADITSVPAGAAGH